MKKEELTPEQDARLRNELIWLLMPCRKGRAIHSIIGEAHALYNCLFLLDDENYPKHPEVNPCPSLFHQLSGVQRVFLQCIRHILHGRKHEGIDLIIADARHVASFI
ncbi:hypothetical protein [Acinetobacter beijerinckii]|uniref:hypothetical protein n=1 Tax=Acinetobacter beijerinckii TaxID=262668 RepID=UPI003AF77F92